MFTSKKLGAFALALLIASLPISAHAQSIVLDPVSASLVAIPATSSDLLIPSTPPPAAPTPLVGLTNAQLGLLPGDVIDALTYLDDAGPIGGTGCNGVFLREPRTHGSGSRSPCRTSRSRAPQACHL